MSALLAVIVTDPKVTPEGRAREAAQRTHESQVEMASNGPASQLARANNKDVPTTLNDTVNEPANQYEHMVKIHDNKQDDIERPQKNSRCENTKDTLNGDRIEDEKGIAKSKAIEIERKLKKEDDKGELERRRPNETESELQCGEANCILTRDAKAQQKDKKTMQADARIEITQKGEHGDAGDQSTQSYYEAFTDQQLKLEIKKYGMKAGNRVLCCL